MTEVGDKFHCQYHNSEEISRLCRKDECNKEAFICGKCTTHGGCHEAHSYLHLDRFKSALKKYLAANKTQQDLSKEGQLSYARMQNFLEETSQSIYKQSQKLTKLTQFMENLNETLLGLQEIGEETDLAYNLLINIDRKESYVTLDKMNDYLNQFFLLVDFETPKDTQELTLKPSTISQIRIKNMLDKKQEFTLTLRKTVEEHERHFEKFVKDMGNLIKEHKSFLVPKQYESEEARLAEFAKRAVYNSYYRQHQPESMDSKKKSSSKNRRAIKNEDDEYNPSIPREVDLSNLEKHGIPKLDQGVAPTCIKKQIFKLCNYLIFYNTLMCESILPEPILKGVPLKKMQSGEFKFPIRCSFCRLLKIRSFVQFYFRFDLVQRFGKLCLFKDKDGRELCAHEMCLLWSNRVTIEPISSTCDVQTLIQAVQFAQAQMCRYCGSIGASLKCNQQDCHVHYHFNCLKQVRLMGLQLDHSEKYRFFCEDHCKPDYAGQSDWFITKIKMKQIIQSGGQSQFTKKAQALDWIVTQQQQN